MEYANYEDYPVKVGMVFTTYKTSQTEIIKLYLFIILIKELL
jgi:hypothetical protein